MINQYNCMLNDARIYLINNEYQEALKILEDIMKCPDTEIQKEAKKMIVECKKAKNFYANQFIFAQSFPILKEDAELQLTEPIFIHNNEILEKNLIGVLKETKKYIEVSFEIIDERFLDELKNM